jgi:YidC/Oxa1 family membrane protein insertase
MESQRWLTFILVVLAITFFYQSMIVEPERQRRKQLDESAAQTQAPEAGQTPGAPGTPEAPTPGAAQTPGVGREPETSRREPAEIVEETGERVVVETDVSRIVLNTIGAVPVSWQITDKRFVLDTPSDGQTTTTLEMIPEIAGALDREYPLEFSIRETGRAGGYLDAFNRRAYTLERRVDDQGAQVLEFTSPPLVGGLVLTKTYRFPGGYVSDVCFELANNSKSAFRFQEEAHGPGVGWGAGLGGVPTQGGRLAMRSIQSAVWLTDDLPVHKTFEYRGKMEVGSARDFPGAVRWAGLTNRYFFAALIPQQPTASARVSAKACNASPGQAKKGSAHQAIELFHAPLLMKPGESVTYDYQIFVGPKTRAVIDPLGEGLDEIHFFSSWRWFRALCLMMMSLLNWIHANVVANYGYAIILMTLFIRLVTQPLVQFSMKSNARFMKVQKKLKPELDEIMKKHKDNPQKKNEETWKLYKKHNANPLGMLKGCFWMMLQMPIFIALYRLLDASIELRGAGFLWIEDLSLPDQLFALPAWFPLISYFNLLPILMTVTQYLTTKLTMSTSTDPTQKQMAIMMPVMFLFIMYNFSAGMVLYWFVSNLWQIASQVLINRSIKNEDEKPKPSPRPVPKPPAKEDDEAPERSSGPGGASKSAQDAPSAPRAKRRRKKR